MAIDETINKLTEQLVLAKAGEAARIRTRIRELESLKRQQPTT